LAVVVAENRIAIDLIGPKKNPLAIQAARPVRIADPFIHSIEHSPTGPAPWLSEALHIVCSDYDGDLGRAMSAEAMNWLT